MTELNTLIHEEDSLGSVSTPRGGARLTHNSAVLNTSKNKKMASYLLFE